MNKPPSKGWTEERRKRQAEIIRQTRPWEDSTGPKTHGGKANARLNALKHGARSEYFREARKMLRSHRQLRAQLENIIDMDPGLKTFVERALRAAARLENPVQTNLSERTEENAKENQ